MQILSNYDLIKKPLHFFRSLDVKSALKTDKAGFLNQIILLSLLA